MNSEMKINSKKKIEIPYWLLKLLPMWKYVCPACRKEVAKNNHECPHCGEKYPLVIRVPPTFLKDSKKFEVYVHKHIFPRVSEFERNYLTKYFTILFSDGFESGDFSAWSSITGTPVISTSTPHHGSYCMSCKVNGEGVNKIINAIDNVYIQVHFKFEAAPEVNALTRIINTWDATWGTFVSVGANTWGADQWVLSTPSGDYYFPATFDTNWHCMELRRTTGAGTGIDTVYLDGEQKITVTTETQGDCVNTFVGGGTATAEIKIDCVVYSDAYIGLEGQKPRGTIAIHAKLAGTI